MPADALGILPWVYDNSVVREREDREDGSVHLAIDLTRQARSDLLRLKHRHPEVQIEGLPALEEIDD